MIGSFYNKEIDGKGKGIPSQALWAAGCYPPSHAQEVFLLLIFVRSWVDPKAAVRHEGLSQWNIPVTPSEIEPLTFGLVAQWLNQLRHSTVINITPVSSSLRRAFR